MDDVVDSQADGRVGQGETPHLVVDGYAGPLDRLLALARAQDIDVRRLPLLELLDQLADAWPGQPSLSRKADWVVMASWLVLLRSRFLLPAAAEPAASARAAALPHDLVCARAEAVALARWLDQQPQLGRDVFARGCPEQPGAEGDMVGFLWASLMVFEWEPAAPAPTAPGLSSVYRVVPLDLPDVPEARERIIRMLAGAGIVSLSRLLGEPEIAGPEADPARVALRRRGAVAATFIAGLELAKQGLLQIEQASPFETVVLSLVDG